jgi:hypothetical protein
MEYICIGVAAVLIIAALAYFSSIKRTKKGPQKKQPLTGNMTCPLCGSRLASGENLFSRIYRPMTVPDQRCTIAGCPHCYPACEPGVKRKCPVCGGRIPADGYLIARLFNKPDGKKHVIVTGCTECIKHTAR